MAEDDKRKKSGSDTGEIAGRQAGKKLGGQIGSGAGRGAGAAAGGAGSAAGTGAGTAAGTTAGTAAGTAAGTGAGTAAGSAAGSAVAPGVGTAIGAGVGAVAGRYWKKILVLLVGGPFACLSLVVIFVLIPVIVVLLILNSIFGLLGPSTAEAAPPEAGAGLVEDFCLGLRDPGDCSDALRKILEDAAAAYRLPAGVLGGILSIEGPHVFGYSDAEIAQYGLSEGGADPVHSTPNECGAVGPMQFLTGSGGTSACPNPGALTLDVWSQYSNAINEVTGLTRVTLVQNIMDSIYGAAKKLRADASRLGVEPDKVIWNRDDVFKAAGAYSGSCDVATPTGTYSYCQIVYDYYLNNNNRVVSGDTAVPSGWPVTGSITTLYCTPTGVESCHSGLDIASNGSTQSVYASMGGRINGAYWSATSDRVCGGVVDIVSGDGFSYGIHFVHLSSSTVDQWSSRVGEFIDAGTLIGQTYEGSLPNCSSGTHLHYTVWKGCIGCIVDPIPYTPGASLGQSVTVGGGAWLPQ